MKALNKYGSSYPLASSRHEKKEQTQRKAGDAVLAAPAMPALALPHERDESIDKGGGAAFQDLKQGQPDTDQKQKQKQKM
jgi:hypothetical protein